MISSFILVCALAAPTFEQNALPPPSPCPDVLTYEPPGEQQNRWNGVINVVTDTQLNSLSLTVILDEKADILVNWVGDVSTQDNKEFRVENDDTKINPGSSFPIRFFVQYGSGQKTPRVQSIILNGREICNANSDVQKTSTTTPEPNRFQPVISVNSNQQSQCGLVLLNSAIPLVVDGAPTLEGQWPWQVAIYQTQTVDIHKYICGGTLVSHRHVITAAHCTVAKDGSGSIDPSWFTLFLGRHNLKTSSRGVQIRLVSKIKMHPSFDKTLRHDLAILELIEPIFYTDFVQPACLWPEDQSDLSYIVGRNGSVAGWGFDSAGLITEELTLAMMPVVSQDTCLRSHNSFFVRFTSDYTYCAGSRDGTSVCNGDSGGGMVFNQNGVWYLRGVVSLAISIPNERRCDPSHYVIFTDVAKHLQWIKQNIDNL